MSERPLLRVVRGTPSDEEVAALAAVVTGLASAESEPAAPRSAWADPRYRLRGALRPEPGAWRRSGLPE